MSDVKCHDARKTSSEGKRDVERDMERALRFGADRLCLWCLCGSAACRRTKACRGDVRACAHLIVSWLAAIDAEISARPDFDAIESQIETPAQLRAYRAWRRVLDDASC